MLKVQSCVLIFDINIAPFAKNFQVLATLATSNF